VKGFSKDVYAVGFGLASNMTIRYHIVGSTGFMPNGCMSRDDDNIVINEAYHTT
jgi:hypothetical protein